MKNTKSVTIKPTLSDQQAWEFAQFLKRVSFKEYRDNAESEAQAYAMRDAGEVIRASLAEAGYDPS